MALLAGLSERPFILPSVLMTIQDLMLSYE